MKFSKRNQSADTVMALCIQEADVKRQVNMEFFIMTGDHVKGISKVVRTKAAIPVNGGIGI